MSESSQDTKLVLLEVFINLVSAPGLGTWPAKNCDLLRAKVPFYDRHYFSCSAAHVVFGFILDCSS
jgi:hypothetical protein